MEHQHLAHDGRAWNLDQTHTSRKEILPFPHRWQQEAATCPALSVEAWTASGNTCRPKIQTEGRLPQFGEEPHNFFVRM